MTLQKLVDAFVKMLTSDKWEVQIRCTHITKVEIYYDDGIVFTIKDKKVPSKKEDGE